MGFLYGKPTGAYRANGTPHRQPRLVRRLWCVLTGLVDGERGHRPKFAAHPSGSCIHCGYWPRAAK